MRILVVAGIFPELTETFVLNQAKALARRYSDVTVLAIHPSGEVLDGCSGGTDEARIKVLDTNLPARAYEVPPFLIRAAFRVVKKYGLPALLRCISLRSRRDVVHSLERVAILEVWPGDAFDIIHCHFGPNGQVLASLRPTLKDQARLFTVFHGYDMSDPVIRGERDYQELFRVGERFLPISDVWKRKLVAIGCPEDRISRLHLGVDTDRIQFRPRAMPLGRPIEFLSVGRLIVNKGHAVALQALAALARDWTYTVVGDGPLMGGLQDLARQLGVAERVHFMGAQPHEQALSEMASRDVLIQPSLTAPNGESEGLPVVLMEAMASGIPVVTTRLSAIPELVKASVNGVLVDEDSVPALLEGLGWLLAHPDEWERLETNARQTVERDFDAATQLDRLAAIYETPRGMSR